MAQRATSSDKVTLLLGAQKRRAFECAERQGISLTAWIKLAIDAAADRQERAEKKRHDT